TYGVGMLIGFCAAGLVTDRYRVAGGHDWVAIWAYPAVFALAVAALFVVSFRNERIGHAVAQS
ncbi:MAG: nucleoside permease, partial [Proteobacteria bacterium]|nr:nucleoside permease [Pseudomonadota bacterium]